MESFEEQEPTTSLHHLGVCAHRGKALASKLCKIMGLRLWAIRETKNCRQWVLKRQKIIMVVSERVNDININNDNELHNNKDDLKTADLCKFHEDEEDWTVFCCTADQPHPADSVFNIALRVGNINECMTRIPPANVIKHVTIMSNQSRGSVKYAIVKSIIGNVVHTLIDDSEYSGPFLPGYVVLNDRARNHLKHLDGQLPVLRNIENRSRSSSRRRRVNSVGQSSKPGNKINSPKNLNPAANSEIIYSEIDHIALACRTGEYKVVMEWYAKCLNFQRFMLNSTETTEDGFVISNQADIGVRLLAMEYWKCREYSLISPKSPQTSHTNANVHQTGCLLPNGKRRAYQPLQIVIAESLDNSADQITKFLTAHGGPGVQHIALSCPNIFATRRLLAKRGLQFLVTPEAYYQDDEIVDRIAQTKTPTARIYGTGILIDTEESEADSQMGSAKEDFGRRAMQSYLLQIFTKPVFDQTDTFFLELIERHQTKGFGAGNIPALWRAVKSYMDTRDEPN